MYRTGRGNRFADFIFGDLRHGNLIAGNGDFKLVSQFPDFELDK